MIIQHHGQDMVMILLENKTEIQALKDLTTFGDRRLCSTQEGARYVDLLAKWLDEEAI